jgi:pyruvate formate lyase activating enzyme
VIFLEYAVDVAAACQERGIRNVAVTAGYITEDAREEFFQRMDAVNVDLKAFTERFYWKICGGHLEPVLETLRYLRSETNAWLELTTLLIPGENDADSEIDAMTRWIADELGCDVPLHFTAFHPSWKMMDTPSTPKSTLTRCREIALRNGLHYVYTGNVHDPAGASTYCPGCGTVVIGRDGYDLGGWNLAVEDGKAACGACGKPIAGVFDARPGHWGAKRQPLHIAMH